MRKKEEWEGVRTGKWRESKKGKNFQLVSANVNSRFYTSTVSRRGQPAGRSNSAEVIKTTAHFAFAFLLSSHACMSTRLS